MSTSRFASLLSRVATTLVCASLLACSGAVSGSTKADAGPDDDGCGGFMGDDADGGVFFGDDTDARAPVEGGGEAGPTCVSPTPIAADNPMGTACLADMQATCGSALAACAKDCACSGLATGCLDTAFDLGVVECLSAAQGPIEGQLFDCIYSSAPCNVAKDGQPTLDAGAGD